MCALDHNSVSSVCPGRERHVRDLLPDQTIKCITKYNPPAKNPSEIGVCNMPLYCYTGRGNNTRIFHQGDGYFYHLSNNRPNRKYAYLRCVHSRTKKYQCFGTAKALLAQDVFVPMHIHSHEPNVLYPYVCALKADIFARVKAGDQTPFNDIMQQEGQKYPMAVRAQVAFGSVCNRMNAIRSNLRPPVPPSLGVLGASLLLPQYKYLTECLHVPESMFAGICGSMADKTLSLVFISPEMKNFMETRCMVFADGTERKLFRKPKASQIYVISAAWRFHAIAMCRAIMLKRTQVAYEVLLNFLKTLMPNFKPKYVKCDFEDAQLNGWKTCFPNADIEGCLWHYDVAVYSMAKNKLGLYQLVKDQEEVASIIRSFGALPLLPSADIEQGLNELGLETVEKGWMPQLRPFFKYWVKEWVSKIPVLSVKGSTHRTNNLSETTNRSFNKAVETCNPSCFHVIRAFVITNDRYTSDLHTLALNLQPGRGRKISALRNDARIKQLTVDYENGDISCLHFLHQASRRMQNVFNKVFK